MKGLISLTCDAWQASNSDGYFAVTGSWINEENAKWQLQTALLGFTQLNNAHNGTRLGQALFKIVLFMRLEETRRISQNDKKLMTCVSQRRNGSALVYSMTFLPCVWFLSNELHYDDHFSTQHADNAQHAFSSEQGTTLHLA